MEPIVPASQVHTSHVIVYTSEFTGDPGTIGKVLDGIRVTAKARNKVRGITGVLFYENGRFLQLVEGNEFMVRLLMSELAKDPKHKNITILIDESIPAAKFPEWQMDTFDISDPQVFTRQQLLTFRDLYKRNVKMNGVVFIEILKGVLSDPGVLALINR